ncbi:acyltransferase [Pantoea sp. Al-1710]|uniref:Acyltransferase n=1 Tax=Candidatus Pantoea communis TaxID=2608354 RepID=A0ABX0RJY6_9GAMM|nr:acyltransferase [Pantoea communis]NIG17419.1 acyltransferase [Pantoea communis]
MKHVKGLDGLRAIAVSMVLIQHYIFNYYLEKSNELGGVGVSIFFVISGFLITSILLKQKDRDDYLWYKFSSFYVRRFLRIVPVFYIIITIGVCFNLYWFTEISPIWHYLYATNIYIFLTQDWVGYTGHFWSLDVEEQFYLIWPALILLSPKNKVVYVILATFLLGMVFTPLTSFFGLAEKKFYALPFTHFDTISAGALLAWAVYNKKIYNIPRKGVKVTLNLSLIVFVITYFSTQIFQSHKNYGANTQLMYMALLVFSVCIVYYLYAYEKSRVKDFLEFKPLALMGKISYAFYLIHNLVPEMYVGTRFTPVSSHSINNVFVWSVTSFALASISWVLIERPILSKKDSVESLFKKSISKKIEC